jgi:hypothetical protein
MLGCTLLCREANRPVNGFALALDHEEHGSDGIRVYGWCRRVFLVLVNSHLSLSVGNASPGRLLSVFGVGHTARLALPAWFA